MLHVTFFCEAICIMSNEELMRKYDVKIDKITYIVLVRTIKTCTQSAAITINNIAM